MKSGYFPSNLVVECIQKEESDFRFKLFIAFTYVPPKGFFGQITVPPGFKTDFASVPWFFRRFIPKTGKYNEAAVIHDYLCFLWKTKHFGIKYRQEADKLFYTIMGELGVKSYRRKFMWFGVGAYTKALKWKLIRLKKGEY
jgi:hypothetical protein